MTKNKNKYWQERIKAEMEARLSSTDTVSSQMRSLYDYYFDNIQKEIESFYQRYANKNGLTKAEAKKRVSEFDVQAFSNKAARYVREKDFSAEANRELAIYNLKMKVSRLEMLQYNLDLEMIALADEEHKITERFLKDGYTEELTFQSGIMKDTVATPKHIGDISQGIINAPFKGATWSQNIWKRQDLLRGILQKEVSGAILKGRNPVELIPQLRKEFDVSYQHARRLAITEYARVQSEVQKSSMRANGFEKYVYLAEAGACKICAPHDDKVYRVSEMAPGENCAPMHPYCRCSTAPVFEKQLENGKEKVYNKIMNSMKRNKDPNKRRPVPIVRQKELSKAFRERGGKVWQDEEAAAYLSLQGADAICLGEDLIVLQKKPIISEVLEELYHAEQHFRGEIDTNSRKSIIEAEIAAQKYLLSVTEQYKIPRTEVEQTQKALKAYLKELEDLENEK